MEKKLKLHESPSNPIYFPEKLPNVLIALLVGLPAAGKTTFGQYLTANASIASKYIGSAFHEKKENEGELQIQKIDISYGNPNNELTIWHIEYDQNIDLASDHTFKQKREDLESCVEEFLGSLKQRSTLHIVVIDDNNYYESMRKPYQHIAEKLSLSYCDIYLPITVDEAIKRNEGRNATVGVTADVIKRMHTQLEVPRNARYSLTVKDNYDIREVSINLAQGWIGFFEETNKKLQTINEQEADRALSNSLINRLELFMRKIIGEIAREIDDPACKKITLNAVNERKKKIMSGVKTIILNEPSREQSELERYLENIIRTEVYALKNNTTLQDKTAK